MENARFMITALSSGSGKTVIAAALMSAFSGRGLKVAACKCGPDYIDPMFHREALGVESENLDLFFLSGDVLRTLFLRHARQAEVTVLEGVMGYYDGMSLDTDRASSFEVARTLDVPAILVVPCKGAALSLVPLILGALAFREESNIRGILLNRISGGLFPRMKQMIEEELSKRGFPVPVIGYVPEDEVFRLKSRHLGLVLPREVQDIQEQLRKAGKLLAETVDLDLLLEIGRKAGEEAGCEAEEEEGIPASHSVKVAVARDEAFCFYYKDNLELLEELGCELVEFSPLHDTSLPQGISGLILGGGYPELYAAELSGNRDMCRSISSAVKAGLPCLAECGGFLYLHTEMEGADGSMYPMADVIQASARRKERLVRFGYMELSAGKAGSFLGQGEVLRGHEFHYYDSTDNGSGCTAVKPDKKRSWKCVHAEGNLFAGFPHVHFYSNPSFARRFAACCRTWTGKEG